MNNSIDFVIEGVISYGCSIYLLPMEICWGFVRGLGYTIVDQASSFILSPNYFCDEIAKVCKKTDYVLLDENEYIERVLSDKPDSIKNDNFLN